MTCPRCFSQISSGELIPLADGTHVVRRVCGRCGRVEIEAMRPETGRGGGDDLDLS